MNAATQGRCLKCVSCSYEEEALYAVCTVTGRLRYSSHLPQGADTIAADRRLADGDPLGSGSNDWT